MEIPSTRRFRKVAGMRRRTEVWREDGAGHEDRPSRIGGRDPNMAW